jgi:asparagine synthase (glutamine-hydrolysing)
MEKEHTNALLSLLEESVRKCVTGERSVGLVYSSGVDSTLVGFMASRFLPVRAYNVGVSGSQDTAYARKESKTVPFDVYIIEVTEEDVEKALPLVVAAIGEPNPLKVAVGIPFYFASKKASEEGFSVMLCGQGGDELFGGYSKYLDELKSGGYSNLEAAMRRDVEGIYESQLKYDERVCNINHVKLMFPFMDKEFVEYALSIPAELKVKGMGDKQEYACADKVDGRKFIRKFILREAAKKAGVPAQILNRPKKAAQYGSGVQKAIDKIARNKFKNKALEEGRSDYVRFYMENIWDENQAEKRKRA